MRNATFKVEGMHCDGCARTVKALIEREPGVRAADVSYEGGQARVLYDPQAVDEDHLVATIERSGYRVVARDA